MTAYPLPTSTPSAAGVDASAVHRFLDALESDPGIEPHSVMILRHGSVAAAGWWAPYSPDRLHLMYSLSKSFTSTAAAFAVAEGLLRLDDPVLAYFPELDAEVTDPRRRALLVRHVASMATGDAAEKLLDARARDPEDLVRGFLLLPPEQDPGTVFAYNQPATYTLAAIVQKVTGQPLTAYLRPRLFEPLGIGEARWLRDRSGRELGFSGLHVTTDAVARLGQLYLRRGVWRGERLLSEEWVAEATRPHIATGDDPAGDWTQGYGFQFWMCRPGCGFRGDGAYGQFCLVLPEHDAVVALTAATERMQEVLDAVWTRLLPGFHDAPPAGREAEDRALADRLAGLSLPPAPDSPASPGEALAFAPAEGRDPEAPRLTAVELDPDGKRVTLVEDGERLELALGAGWTVTEGTVPAAVSGGWTDDDTLALDVALLETPHHVELVCDRVTGTFTARWRPQPLHAPRVTRMRAPREEG